MKWVTILTLVVAAAVMMIAGVAAPRTNATQQLCHSSPLAITAPATAKAKTVVMITGAEAAVPQHPVKATLQSRLSTSKRWVNGASKSLANGAYSLKWKAPAKKGKYKVRVRVTHAGASNASAVKTITVN
jgi:ribulose 1,5-bisphosphate synthetase/thiazole synthase